MTEGSTQIVTQHDPFANHKFEPPLSVLREAVSARLSASSRVVLTWVCLHSGGYGCLFKRMEDVAHDLRIQRRILTMRLRDLVRAGWLRIEHVSRGGVLPSGERANRKTAVLYPIMSTVKSCSQDQLIKDQNVSVRTTCTPFCDQKEVEEDLAFSRSQNPDPEANTGAKNDTATVLLLEWHRRLAPQTDLRTWVTGHWLALIRKRLCDVTEAECRDAIEGHVISPHNQVPERRTLPHVFGSLVRLQRMAEVGRAGPKNGPKKVATQADPQQPLTPELRNIATGHGLRDVEAIWTEFKNTHIGRGTEMVDWNAAWIVWCSREKRYQKSGRTTKTTARPPSFVRCVERQVRS